MSRRERPPAIVAELGRPETPDETAARKAQNSRNHRDRQTTRNLVLALVASLGIVVLLVLIVPRGDVEQLRDVDYRATAEQASADVGEPLVVPDVPDTWSSNVAELRTGAADGVTSWYVGFITAERDFVGFSQGLDANPSWLSAVLDGSLATGTTDIGGAEWTVYDHRDEDGRGNLEYALALEDGGDVFVIYGTADPSEAEELAETVTKQVRA
ncbi:DUF4245 domain-containing protein [Herbiconiux sp. L3-i23]|uniref:DUF4245 domain-containing protein n=1 Tax=Herbiconiux sp. L3-i23 TaxID=2905871 RepID=UPI0020675A04|nr:DUF4245 domain-containing protein [Herbiconiux sp. L3-i23]BDI23562.1 hypothetical protein L3i23_23380 [Herbiconiux sp. L3-i23]